MGRLASYALVAAVALVGAGCASSHMRLASSRPVSDLPRLGAEVDPADRVGPGPFAPSGGWTGGGESGLLGDGATGARGTSLGCLAGRRYSYAFGVENKTKAPVTLISATGPNPAPRIVDRVATQLRLSPPRRPRSSTLNWGGDGIDLVYRGWSAAPTKPVTIPRHRTATIQVDFLMRDCAVLAQGESTLVPGSLVLTYRASGHSGRQRMTLPGNRFVVSRGPTKRTCAPVAGSGSLVTSDVSCAFARHAAPLCRAMHNGGWLGCTVAGRYWECGRFAGPGFPLNETCYLPHEKSHWFSVVWAGHGLGIWGAVQNRRANLGWSRLDAWPTTTGICRVHRDLRTLEFRSSALRLVRGKVVSHARAIFVLRNYHGVGRHSAGGFKPMGGAPVVVMVDRANGTRAFYLATAGRVTILHARNGTISGQVYASLHRRGGSNRISLNGTWTCRAAH